MNVKSIVLATLLAGAVGASQATVINGTLFRTGGAALGTQGAWFLGADNSVETTVDRHDFRVNSAGIVSFDILSWEADPAGGTPTLTSAPVDVNGDGEIAFFDAMIRVYDAATNALIATNDDSASTFGDGSIYNRDSFLSVALAAGDYFLAVGSFDLSAGEGLAATAFGTGPMTWDGRQYVVADHGDYQLTITGDVRVVPEPSTLALAALALAGFGVGRRHRR